ncbi:MAG: sporulation peptidase YabG [Clostridia bacterium]|nr:sporulation peptidase YabG [Clostridia bacterium]
MNTLKKGDIVSRKSHNNDILFYIEDIFIDKNIAKLKGIVVRIEADSYIEDLILADETRVSKAENLVNKMINSRRNIDSMSNNYGKILHLDGDKSYSKKTEQYYKKRGLNYVVRHVTEQKQPYEVEQLLKMIKPDILVITGHDGMLKKGRNYNDINNYRNSKYFIKAVRAARNIYPDKNDLIIFAGACQSFYEALIYAGANFASSPGRILIDFLDPLIIAEKVSITDRKKIVFMSDLEGVIRNGRRAVGGIGAVGKCL